MITVYTKNDCAQCRMTKNLLKIKNIAFTEIDVEENDEARTELELYGYKSLPVVAIESLDNSWWGFRPDKIETLGE